MTVVDVDAHVFEPFTWLEDTNPALQAEIGLPPSLMDTFFGELLAAVPPEQARRYRDPMELGNFLDPGDGPPLSPKEAQARWEASAMGAQIYESKGILDADERIEANDEQGIDIQFIHPTMVLGMTHGVLLDRPDLFGDYCEAYNRWVLSVYGDHVDRLMPSALIDFADPDRAVAELTRVREAGSRTFLVPMTPVQGRPPSHPDFDRIWAASVDLGMIPTLHVTAAGPKYDLDWLNTGRDNDPAVFWRLGFMYTPTVPMLALGDLIFSGLFDRHPDMTVLCAEWGLTWLLGFMDKLDDARSASTAMGLGMAPTDYIRRNVRFSPLPASDNERGQTSDPVDWFIETYGPDLLWFASDYPHPEGSAHAIEQFDAMLDGKVDNAIKKRFYGAGALEVLNKGA